MENPKAINLDLPDKKPNYYKGKILWRNYKGMSPKWKIKNFFSDLKDFYWRGRRGFDTTDAFNINSWFLEVMPHLLHNMMENMYGFPGREPYDTYEKWVAVLERMKYCFEEANEDTCSQQNEWDDTFDIEWVEDKEREKHEGSIPMKSVITNEENWEKWRERDKELYEYRQKMQAEGLDLFKEVFNDLWD